MSYDDINGLDELGELENGFNYRIPDGLRSIAPFLDEAQGMLRFVPNDHFDYLYP